MEVETPHLSKVKVLAMMSPDDQSWLLWLTKLAASLAIVACALFAKSFDDMARQTSNKCLGETGRDPQQTEQSTASSIRSCNDGDTDSPALLRKREFLSRAGDNYGYASSPRGFIDTWRKQEFPTMIAPLHPSSEASTSGKKSAADAHENDNSEVYLDYAGAALPSRSQLEAIHAFSTTHLLANPHSTGPAAARTLRLIEEAKQEILSHLNARPGQFAAVNVGHTSTSTADESMFHPGYDVIFTAGATDSLRIVAERFPWTEQSTLLYTHNAHTSVIGMRGTVLSKGGRFLCKHLEDILQIVGITNESDDTELVGSWEQPSCTEANANNQQPIGPTRNLLVIPVECNFGGDRPNAVSVVQRISRLNAKRERDSSPSSDQVWSTMLDLAKAASTAPVDLKQLDPDFACLSFYKIFGYPTGLGALLVRRTATELLVRQQTKPNKIRHYFGGGSVDVALPKIDFAVGRHVNLSLSSNPEPSTAPPSLASLVNGTLHFNGIVSIPHGIRELRRLGGMQRIQAHTRTLALELTRRFSALRHGNGQVVVIIYGGWGNDQHRHQRPSSKQRPRFGLPGPTIAFNISRHDGNFVGYNEVSKLAALNHPPIQLRSGCFCNPGGCQDALGLSNEEIQHNYEIAGHICGDDVDRVNGKPTGALRASFGKDSLWEDLDALVCFIEKHFVSSTRLPTTVHPEHGNVLSTIPTTTVYLKEMYIYPIKSCAAQRVKKWKLALPAGRLILDREFALVDSLREAMRLQQYPKMGLIRPIVDPERGTLVVSAPGMDDLVVQSGAGERHNIVRVCGNDCGGRLWGSFEASAWFSEFLGVPCWLARFIDGGYHKRHRPKNVEKSPETIQRHSFSNEQPLLLISKHAVDALNTFLVTQSQPPVTSEHFRPNFVTAADCHDSQALAPHNEDNWSSVEIAGESGYTRLDVCGLCARCGMVDFHPRNGEKGKTLRALAEIGRRTEGSIHFGIFLQGPNEDEIPRDMWVEEGAVFACK